MLQQSSVQDNVAPAPVLNGACGVAAFSDSVANGPKVSRILIVDDHALLRVGLQALLRAERSDVEFVEAYCLQDAIDVFASMPGIDLVVLDLNMSDCRGLQGVRQFKERFPHARLAVLSATQDEFVMGQAKALGAIAYISKACEPRNMSKAIFELLLGQEGAKSSASTPRSSRFDRVAELGARHLEILDLLLFGCSNQEISSATHLSLGTVKNYVSLVLLALDVKSRAHLISLFR